MAAAEAVIVHRNLEHNLQQVRQLAGSRRVTAMVKANGYGHGLVEVARTLKDADGLGVASLDEAIVLRQAGVTQPLTVMVGFACQAELDAMGCWGLETVVHQPDQLQLLQKKPEQPPCRIWLKINTGMNRLGFMPQDLAACIQALRDAGFEANQLGLMTHLATADEPQLSLAQQQLNLFQDCCQPYSLVTSVANSAGLIHYPDFSADWVRPGIMLYGASPMRDQSAQSLGLKPVMTLRTRVLAIHSIQKGESVGYAAQWRCERATIVAVVAIGYGDGYPLGAVAGTPVSIAGRSYPLVGRVSMDMLTIDLGPQSDIAIGDVVECWGEAIAVDEVAQCASTLGYQLLAGVAARVKRVHVY